jgi:hypothetical protein
MRQYKTGFIGRLPCKNLQEIPEHAATIGFGKPRCVKADPDFAGSAAVGRYSRRPVTPEAAGFESLGFLPSVVVHSVLRGERQRMRPGTHWAAGIAELSAATFGNFAREVSLFMRTVVDEALWRLGTRVSPPASTRANRLFRRCHRRRPPRVAVVGPW